MTIDNKVFLGEKTDEEGNLELSFKFNGWIEEIDVDYGELGMETKITVTTSTGRVIPMPFGNDSNIFPIFPRTNANEKKFAGYGVDAPVVVRYVNKGELLISIESGDADRLISKIEVIFEK